jgi:hypothetical protein
MLNPRNLMLSGGKPRVADFGLAQLLWLPSGQPVAERNARYTAPELLERRISPRCDQYSLALVYHELLTGSLPPRGKGKSNLGLLPEADRAAIGRALERDPGRRYASNSELIQALKSPRPAGRVVPAATPSVAERPLSDPALVALPAAVAEAVVLRKFRAEMSAWAALLSLKALCKQVQGTVFREQAHVFGFHVQKVSKSWKSWLGRPPAIEVQFQLVPAGPNAVEATVQLLPVRCAGAEAAALLEELGPQILQGVRAQMQGDNPDRRGHDRLKWDRPLLVTPVRDDGADDEPILCRGKDISLTGIGFYVSQPLPTWQVSIQLPSPFRSELISVPATLVRNKRREDGSYEVGALFRLAPAAQNPAPAGVSA